MMPAPDTPHNSIRAWLLSRGFITVCILFTVFGMIALSVSIHPGLIMIASALTISGAVTLFLGSFGLIASLMSFFWSTPTVQTPPKPMNTTFTDTFHVTANMLEHLKTLGIEVTVGEHLNLDAIHHHYKQKARKLHPDRNKSTNAHAEFLELQSAYDTLKTLIQRQLDPLGLSAELTAHFNALDEELNELQQGYKDLGQTITRYNQNADQFIQGVNALNQQTEEVLQLASEYNNNVQRYNERADQYIAKAEQYIARVTQNSILVQENGEQLKALTAGFGECNDQLQANQQSISDLNAELSQLLQARRLAANSQQATNPHRLMKPPTITPVNKDETLSPTNANR